MSVLHLCKTKMMCMREEKNKSASERPSELLWFQHINTNIPGWETEDSNKRKTAPFWEAKGLYFLFVYLITT